MISIKAAIEYHESYIRERKYSYETLKREIRKTGLEKAVAALVAAEPKVSVYVTDSYVFLDIPIKSMKHMTEALEFLQARLNIEFDKSQDSPSAGFRTFQSNAANWLIVRAMVSQNDEDDSALCKRVITGYKTVEQPVYQLECKDTTTT